MGDAECQNRHKQYVVNEQEDGISLDSFLREVSSYFILFFAVVKAAFFSILARLDPGEHQNAEDLPCELDPEHYQNLRDVSQREKGAPRLLHAELVGSCRVAQEDDGQEVQHHVPVEELEVGRVL